jgi:hypothetical protein
MYCCKEGVHVEHMPHQKALAAAVHLSIECYAHIKRCNKLNTLRT